MPSLFALHCAAAANSQTIHRLVPVEGKEREKERSRDGEAAAMLGSVVKGHVGAGLVGAPRGSSLGHQQAQVQKPRERER